MRTTMSGPLSVACGVLMIGIFAVLGLIVVVAGPAQSSARAPVCVGSGTVQGLSSAQAENAQVVVATAAARAGARAAYIAVLIGITESNLLALGNPHDATAAGLVTQGVGFDHDSVGIFQQRPSWGTAAQRMDPQSSTDLFLDALLSVPDWSSLDPWVAAQQVQRSAFTGTPGPSNGYSSIVGGNYLAHSEQAQLVFDQIQQLRAHLDCGASVNLAAVSDDPPVVGEAAGSASARIAVTYALAQRGKPYLWGGTGPVAFDCSGLMLQAWRAAGVSLDRTTSQQIHDGVAVTAASLSPGDLVLIPGSEGTVASPGHVGMYVGSGLVVHAPRTGDVVKVVTLSSFVANGVAGYRHVG